MSIAQFGSVLKIFGGSEPTAEEKQTLLQEVLLMTLSRASSSDANIHPCEVETVRDILKRMTGNDFSTADIRVAAGSEIYETAPLERYLASAGRKLAAADRAETVKALAQVIRSDAQVTSREVEFFNMVADALRITPAELAGLIPA